MAKMGSSANGWLSLIRRVQERLESVNARPGLGVYQHPACDLCLVSALAFSRPLALQCLPRVRQGLPFHPVGTRPVSLGTNPDSNIGSFFRLFSYKQPDGRRAPRHILLPSFVFGIQRGVRRVLGHWSSLWTVK